MIANLLIITASVVLLGVLILAGPLVGRHIERSRMRSNIKAGESRWDVETSAIDLATIDAEDTQRWLLLGEHYFWKDPLGSLSLPLELDEATPIAGQAFDALAAEAAITGVGADIDAEWHDWNLELDLMMRELVPA